MKNCILTELKSEVQNNALPKLGTLRMKVLANKTAIVRWSNFDSTIDKVEVLDGSAVPTISGQGYNIAAGNTDCIIEVSNIYKVTQLNGASGDSTHIVVNPSQFYGFDSLLSTCSRIKFEGMLRSMLMGNALHWCELNDFSNANGSVNISNITGNGINIIGGSSVENISIVALTDINSWTGWDAENTKVADSTIELSKIKVSSFNFTVQGVKFKGNIETDFNATSTNRIRLDGGELTGALEKFIEKQISVKSIGGRTRVLSTSAMTLIGRSLVNANYIFHFNADDVTITAGESATVIGRYTKSTGVWAWED